MLANILSEQTLRRNIHIISPGIQSSFILEIIRKFINQMTNGRVINHWQYLTSVARIKCGETGGKNYNIYQ